MKQFNKLLFFTTIVLAVLQDNNAFSQNKFNIGISSPTYFGTGRFGSYMEMKNEIQGHSGKDALKFRPSTGFGIFGELEFKEEWIFEMYYQKYSNKTNFGKNNVDNYTPTAAGKTSQYKISHSIIGVGASRKAFKIKGYDMWIFSALSAGSRKYTWRPEGGEFSNERKTTNKTYLASSAAPMYLNIGLSPRFTFAKKFILSAKAGYEMEVLKGEGMYGFWDIIQPTYATTNPNVDRSKYTDPQKASLNRFFIELRAGMKLGK